MTEKGCDNCYYTYFDEKAYPCSLCTRGVERTDQWQPSKKTKAQIDCRRCIHFTTDKCQKCYGKELFIDSGYITKLNEPKTDCSWK